MAWVERRQVLVLAMFAALYLVAVLPRMVTRPLWNDEIFTYYEIGLPSMADVVAAKLDGLDAAPPLDVLLGHVLARGLGHHPWVARLPGMLGILAAALGAYVFARRRGPPAVALIAPLALCSTTALTFAWEARPYGMALGFSALALVGWQGAILGRPRRVSLLLLALGGSGALAAHYYVALVMVAIVVGEAVRSIQRRRVDPAVLAACAVPLLLLIPLAPFIGASRGVMASTWAAPGLGQIEDTYGRLFLPAVLPLCAALGLMGIALLTRGESATEATRGPSPVTVPEIAALVTLLALPFIAVVATLLVAGPFTTRYALAVTLAPSLLVPLMVRRLDRSRGLLTLAFLVPLGFSLLHQGADAIAHHHHAPDVTAGYPLVTAVPANPVPIAVGNGHAFTRLWHYAPQPLRARLVFLNSIETAGRIEGRDTLARDLDALRRWTPVPVLDEFPFLEDHREFWVYDFEFGWLVPRLLELGATLEVRERDGPATLYLATMPG